VGASGSHYVDLVAFDPKASAAHVGPFGGHYGQGGET
jgi:hypothetical protein